MDEINIGCIRTDQPPWNNPSDSPHVWWASMVEDCCDGYGATAAEAIGNLIMKITLDYLDAGKPMPYIKSINWQI